MIVVLWSGLLFAVLGLALCWNEWRCRQNTIAIPGRVAGHSFGRKKGEGTQFYHSVTEFTGPDGQMRFIESSIGSSSPLGQVGQSVVVHVKRDDPSFATLASPMIYLWGGICFAIGLVGLWVGIQNFVFDWLSIGISVAVFVQFAHVLWSARRKTKMSWEEWRKRVKSKTTSRVFLYADREQIPWVTSDQRAELQHKQYQSNRMALPILLLLTLGCGWGSSYSYEKTEKFLSQADRAEGRVVELVESQSSDSSSWAPIIEFQSPGGSPVRFRHSISSSPPSYSVGDKVRVLYDPKNPANARLDLGRWNQVMALLLGGLSVLFAFMSLSVYRAQERFQSLPGRRNAA